MHTNLDIEAVRRAALHLHRVLIQAVRLDYERANGRVGSPTDLWQLVAYDPQFAWLRPLSRWLVAMDDDGPIGQADADEVSASDVIAAAVRGLDQSDVMRSLNHSAAVRGELENVLSDPEWSQRYMQLLQDVPEVVLAHATLQRELQRLPAGSRWDEPALMS